MGYRFTKTEPDIYFSFFLYVEGEKMYVVLNPMQCIMSAKQVDSQKKKKIKHRKHENIVSVISSMVQQIKVLGYLSSLKILPLAILATITGNLV